MSNRQPLIIGSFALACCLVVALTFRGAGANAKPSAPLADDNSSPGRYQVVGVHKGDQAYLVIVDTATGVTWQRSVRDDLAFPDGWNPITSPAQPSKVWTHAPISNM